MPEEVKGVLQAGYAATRHLSQLFATPFFPAICQRGWVTGVSGNFAGSVTPRAVCGGARAVNFLIMRSA